MRSAHLLAAAAATRLVQAVEAAERDDAAPRRAGDAGRDNPFRSRLQGVQAACALRDPRPHDSLSMPPDRPEAQRALDQAASLLDDLVALFAVTLRGDGPAGRTGLVLPAPKPLAARPRKPVATEAQTPAPLPLPRPAIHVAPAAVAGSSSAFWALMDRWGIGDLEALGLLGHPGGLTRKGTRPRFRLSDQEASTLAQLREMDDALSVLELDARDWLRVPIKSLPFRGRAPLDLLLREHAAGADAVHRFVVRLGMRQSLAGP